MQNLVTGLSDIALMDVFMGKVTQLSGILPKE